MDHMRQNEVDKVEPRDTIETMRRADISLRGIYEISKVLTAPARLETTLANLMTLLSSFVQMRHGEIIVLKPDGEPEFAVTAGNVYPPQSATCGSIPQPVIDKIVATGTPFVAPDISQSELFQVDPQIPSSGDALPVSFIGVPLKTQHETIGTLSIDRLGHGSTNVCLEEDVRFLTMVAVLAGQTIRLHRLPSMDGQRLAEETQEQSPGVKRTDRDRHQHAKIEGIVGRSPALKQVLETVPVVASTNAAVLLRGESGTGKEAFAKAIHKLSPRKNKPFVKLNCAALSETVLESELFGHEKGAFTGAISQRAGRFELAHGGTLLLDEIGEISPAFQAKLLRVLQEGELERVGGTRTLKFDVRLICATNKNLETAVLNGAFRADLYYRINVIPITLPPLRERPGDIRLLADVFLDRFNRENDRDLTFAPSAYDVISQCSFPGNIRELENCVQRTATLARSATIVASDFACQHGQCFSICLRKGDNLSGATNNLAPGNLIALESPLPDSRICGSTGEAMPFTTGDRNDRSSPPMGTPLTRDRLLDAMERAGWNQSKAARILGLTARQVGYAIRRHGIEVKKF
ncbi:nif-specific transcriptional activator NifA [Mesorhizobium sp. WSM3224]|uniref:nif-specific transcriptional activator NifA n=1 Tax=Mesorhizobium sp. WSM3224 TaxID=1040986 RepID=UPI0003FD513D|nr:nif-specific transcriptional activator NifA [Mesorhizobium sp. WSM3224]